MTGLRSRSGERGSVTAWMVLVPLLVAVLGGFSLDLWAGLSTRGRIAAIADDAAAAGATAIGVAGLRGGEQVVELDPEAARVRALSAVDAHPDMALVRSRTAAATPALVTVTVRGEHRFLLLRILGASTAPVVVTGHAAPVALD